jgi:hypothetical protein
MGEIRPLVRLSKSVCPLPVLEAPGVAPPNGYTKSAWALSGGPMSILPDADARRQPMATAPAPAHAAVTPPLESACFDNRERFTRQSSCACPGMPSTSTLHGSGIGGRVAQRCRGGHRPPGNSESPGTGSAAPAVTLPAITALGRCLRHRAAFSHAPHHRGEPQTLQPRSPPGLTMVEADVTRW